jgi:hypothetical protein
MRTCLNLNIKHALENSYHERGVSGQVERYLLIQAHVFQEDFFEGRAVTEDDILKEYEVRKGEYLSPEKISVIDVVLFLSENDPASIKKAEEVLAKIKADKDRDPRNIANTDGIFVIQNLSPLDKERLL